MKLLNKILDRLFGYKWICEHCVNIEYSKTQPFCKTCTHIERSPKKMFKIKR